MLEPENSSYGSTSQSVGHKFGSILSTTVFVALNSIEFCNKYLFAEERTEPLLSISTFIWWWAGFQFVITLYILFFVTESENSSGGEDEEDEEL